MSKGFIITGTDTDIGKTVFAAALMYAVRGHYWKPIQSGMDGIVDTKTVQNLTGYEDGRFYQENYVFSAPLSPHRAAEIDDVEIVMETLIPPKSERPLVIEGAGGLMVPITRKNLQVNVFKQWQGESGSDYPVILCARTGLGTINHTLLSLEALWARDIPVHGVVFIGPDNEDNIRTITEMSDMKMLGHLPMLDDLNPESLRKAFADNFDVGDFV